MVNFLLNQSSPKLTWVCSLFDSYFDLQPRSAGGECTDYVAIFRKKLGKDAGVVPEAKICGSALPDSMQIEGSSMTQKQQVLIPSLHHLF